MSPSAARLLVYPRIINLNPLFPSCFLVICSQMIAALGLIITIQIFGSVLIQIKLPFQADYVHN